ncbi:MAG TPA: hypothetical protein VKA55_02480 [Gammaproteobacteria bacterium]|nr:hypothetical protein [Gammaproteobacteria bacterium]
MTSRLYPPRDVQMLVTIYMDGIPFAMCTAEKASLSAMLIRLSPWALYPDSISEVEFSRQTEAGTERHRIPVSVDKVRDNRARLLFRPMKPEALAALRAELYESEPEAPAQTG